MLLQWLWFAMMTASLLFACLKGTGGQMLEQALAGTSDALALTFRLGAGYLLFCGLMEIVRAIGLTQKLQGALKPFFRRLLPAVRRRETAEAVTLNLAMNLLGLGNAATPMGMEAMRLMAQEEKENAAVRRDMYMLLVLNATSIQLVPTTVLTLRAAAGSAAPHAVLLPTLACTAVSTGVGVLLSLGCRRWEERRR